jgi:hypothetical protein
VGPFLSSRRQYRDYKDRDINKNRSYKYKIRDNYNDRRGR